MSVMLRQIVPDAADNAARTYKGHPEFPALCLNSNTQENGLVMVTTQASITREAVADTLESQQELTRQISEMGEWFHNINLKGIQTAPNHFLGDFPNVKWKNIAPAIPEDFSGATVLDIGCNGGFHSIELKKRGASRVLGVDVDDRYLNQVGGEIRDGEIFVIELTAEFYLQTVDTVFVRHALPKGDFMNSVV